MDSSDTSNHSLSTDEVEEELLQQQYDALLEKVNTQRLILAAVREVNAEQVTDVTDDERKNIDRALNYARAFECLKLDDKGTNIMGKLFLSAFTCKFAVHLQPQHECFLQMIG